MKLSAKKGHLCFDAVDAEILRRLEEIAAEEEILEELIEEYNQQLSDFDPEDPGAVVEQEAKNPIFCLIIKYKRAA